MDADPIFPEALDAIDGGRTADLDGLVARHPRLVRASPEQGRDFLLCFVADNPIRVPKLPPNIVDITRLLIGHIRRLAPDTLQTQLDHTLGLVATGRIPRECGVQIEMMDLLLDAGAKPAGALAALAHGSMAAASFLVDRGELLTLPLAVGLERDLPATAGKDEYLTALTVAAFWGKPHLISSLLTLGAEPNGYPPEGSGFHSHATPLHQAVSSGSLKAVQTLVTAGARLDARDRVYGGTPLDWAMHERQAAESNRAIEAPRYAAIEAYLQTRQDS